MELPVTAWRGDVTDEEFIPQHRILYFRRKGDGIKVWDRKERVDLLFQSGNRDGKENERENANGEKVKEGPAEFSEGNQHDRAPSDDNDNSTDDEEEMTMSQRSKTSP